MKKVFRLAAVSWKVLVTVGLDHCLTGSLLLHYKLPGKAGFTFVSLGSDLSRLFVLIVPTRLFHLFKTQLSLEFAQ